MECMTLPPMSGVLREQLTKVLSSEGGTLALNDVQMSGHVMDSSGSPESNLEPWEVQLGPDVGTAELGKGYIGSVHEFLPSSSLMHWRCVVLRNSVGVPRPPAYTSLPPILDCPLCGNHVSISVDVSGLANESSHLKLRCENGGCKAHDTGTDVYWPVATQSGHVVMRMWTMCIQEWNRKVMKFLMLKREGSSCELHRFFGDVCANGWSS